MRCFLSLALLLLVAQACVPTAARKNARLEGGFDVDMIAGLQHVEAGVKSDGSVGGATQQLHLEIDAQYAYKVDDGSGAAVQLKVPINIIFTSLDFYYQLPETQKDNYYGFGAEAGALPGIYAAMTHYFNDEAYVTLTPRVLLAKSRDSRDPMINPQLTFGSAGGIDLSAFVSYAYHTGEGFNFDVDLFCPDDIDDFRKEFWLAGASARF